VKEQKHKKARRSEQRKKGKEKRGELWKGEKKQKQRPTETAQWSGETPTQSSDQNCTDSIANLKRGVG
jgi:hypothetical protein